MNTNDIIQSLNMAALKEREELDHIRAENERLTAAIDFIENNLVAYGTGYDIEHKQAIFENEFGEQVSGYGKNIFECIEYAKRVFDEIREE